VLTFFQPCGEIKYVRMAGDETQPTRFAFVEFACPDSVPIALQYNGAMFGDRPVK
jgi:arginine/serine-rich splicing factor 12